MKGLLTCLAVLIAMPLVADKAAKVYSRAEVENELATCLKLPGAPDFLCYETAAHHARDVGFCNEIVKLKDREGNPLTKAHEQCCRNVAARFGDKPSLCDAVATQGGKDYCLTGVARFTKDRQVCELIVSKSQKANCEFYSKFNSGATP